MDKSKKNPPAVVVGLSITGLGTVRALAKSGVEVIGVDSDFSSPSAHTRYCKKVYCNDINREESLMETLIAVSRGYDLKPVLFMSTDMAVLIVSENREMLSDYYHFSLPSKASVNIFMEKILFADFAEKNEFCIPGTIVVENYEAVTAAAENIQYPCIIKPSFRDSAWDSVTSTKVFKVLTDEELTRVYKNSMHLADKFIIQELVPGADREVYFCLLWYDSFSKPGAYFTGRKPIQWFPETGSTCIAESHVHEAVLNESIRLFNSVDYKGIGSVEYKKDPRSNEYKIIEPTVGRADLQSAVAYHSGINIPLLEYCSCLGLKLPAISDKKKKIFWINEENLFWVLGSERKRYSWALWAEIIKSKKYYALLSLADPIPGLRFLLRIVKLVFKKRIKGAART